MVTPAEATDLHGNAGSRVKERVRVAWKVKAIVSPEGPDITCIVEEVSAGGARLLIPHNADLPDQFSLYVPLRDETHFIEVSWRDDVASEVGINFLEPHGALQRKRQLDPDTRIAQLEAYIEHLEEQIHRMDGRIATLMERVARLEFP